MKLDGFRNLFKDKGFLSGKKVLTATIIGTVLVASTGTALAAGSINIVDGKWENKLSHGRVEYVDADGGGEVVIDSSDFDTLAVEVDSCNSKINEIITGLGIDTASGTVDLSLLQAGDVVLDPTNKIKSATGTGATIGAPFEGLLAKKSYCRFFNS